MKIAFILMLLGIFGGIFNTHLPITTLVETIINKTDYKSLYDKSQFRYVHKNGEVW
jgi:hypothetical protein